MGMSAEEEEGRRGGEEGKESGRNLRELMDDVLTEKEKRQLKGALKIYRNNR